jgi:uncharacterized metal-binding protein
MMAEDAKFVATVRRNVMKKKLIPLMLGLVLAVGSVAVTFAQDAGSGSKDTSKKKKKKKKSTDTTTPPAK